MLMPMIHVGMPKGGQGGEDGKENGEPLHVEASLKGIHRTTIGMAVAALHTIFHSQQSLGIFRGHAKDACKPAPQHGSRTSQCHGRGHAHNIACADGGRQGCGQGSKLTHIAVGTSVFLHRQANAREQLALGDAQTKGKEDVGSQKENHHGPAPQERAEQREEVIDWFHLSSFLIQRTKVRFYFHI